MAKQQVIERDVTLLKGGDHNSTYRFKNDDQTPKDTTGWTLTRTIRKNFPNGAELDTLETDGTRIINTPGNGQFNIKITAAEIEAYGWTSAEFRDVLDYGDGTTQVLRIGRIKVV
ncbi:MAG: hypothetical protein KC496_00995 [Anaerolineae bacterium]|nr:hypothetical protein [Anaerolineae bacterium]